MISRFRGAIHFLTVLHWQGGSAAPGRAAVFFPVVGALLGWSGAGLFLFLKPYTGDSTAALLVLTYWTCLTGAMHEDGLADVADAVRAGRTRERMFEILKDSRIGTYGALALLFSVLIRWQALAHPAKDPLPLMVAALALPRAAQVLLAWIARPAGDGLGAWFSATLTTPVAAIACLQAVAAALWCGPRLAAIMLAGTFAMVLFAKHYFEERLGGVTGDCFGATSVLIETFLLVLVACPNCS